MLFVAPGVLILDCTNEFVSRQSTNRTEAEDEAEEEREPEVEEEEVRLDNIAKEEWDDRGYKIDFGVGSEFG